MSQYVINLSDQSGRHMVVLTMSEYDLKGSAADLVLDVVGIGNPLGLVTANILSDGQLDDFKALQKLIFDHDEQGQFIREDVSFLANGKELNPDAAVSNSFVPAERDGIKYLRCDLVVVTSEAQKSPSVTAASPAEDQVEAFARIIFLHQIAIGYQIDVTKEFPELIESIADAEKHNWIDIDVQKAAYRLTPEGKRIHDSYIAEAQTLIKRFDIYGDVDVDSSGTVRFDTALGKDMRVAVFETEGVDPFRARFLIGLNDGEFDQLSNWFELYRDEKWYSNLFAAVEQAPGADDIGPAIVRCVIDAGKAELRQDS